jgi:hypothetical protein
MEFDMKKLIIVAMFAVTALPALAANQIKAGLWEVHIIKQVVDGKNTTAQMAAAQKQMQEMLASMPPAQRKQMEQTMGVQAMPGNNVQRICISPEMAKQDKPVVSADNRCEPTNVRHSGNKLSFELKCPNVSGKGESIVNGDTITNRMDMVTTDARGRHTMQSESQMKYLGADCQGIKPLDQIAREMEKKQRR